MRREVKQSILKKLLKNLELSENNQLTVVNLAQQGQKICCSKAQEIQIRCTMKSTAAFVERKTHSRENILYF